MELINGDWHQLPAEERVARTKLHIVELETMLTNFLDHVRRMWSQRAQLIERINAYEREAHPEGPVTSLVKLPENPQLDQILDLMRLTILSYGDPMLEVGFNVMISHLQKQTALTNKYMNELELLKSRYAEQVANVVNSGEGNGRTPT